jgi:hypothetical protein
MILNSVFSIIMRRLIEGEQHVVPAVAHGDRLQLLRRR